MPLTSYGDGLRVAVIGQGGIGRALADQLAADPAVARVHRFARRPEGDATALDVTDEGSIVAAASAVGEPLALVFVATGLLHGPGVDPERDWRKLDSGALAQLFAVNTIGPALVAKHFLPLLRPAGKAAFAALSARVGSISDNRIGGWYGYRASKAALNQIVRCLAVELARKRPEALCVALHPGTVDTGLSKPFQRNVAADGLFTPAVSAAHLLTVLDRLTLADSGELFAWDGARVAP